MKCVITIVLLTVTLASSAQKIRFSDHTNVWTSKGDGMDICPFTLTLSYGTDTVILGHIYQHLVPSFFYGYTPGCSYWTVPTEYLIREDTVAGMIYYRNLSSSTPDTTDQIYFNYNLHVGDTIDLNVSGILGRDSIAAIDSTIINGVYHKIYTIVTRGGATIPCTFVEGIGSMAVPYPYFSDGCFEFSQQLVCFSQNGVFPSMNFKYARCAFRDSFSNASGCATLSTNYYPKPSSSMTVSPNPAFDHIDFTSSEQFDDNTFISIYDVTGRCVCNVKADAAKKSVNINTAQWSSGMYIAVVQNTDGIIKREKIIILK